MPKKLTTFSMRMPEDINEKIQQYAAEHDCTKAEAMSHFARAGIEVEEQGGPVSAQDLAKFTAQLNESQAAAVGEATAAIIPADIRDVVSTYASDHKCSEADALNYFARLGIHLVCDYTVTATSDISEIATKVDALTKDSQLKNEQLTQLAASVELIKSQTMPETLELEGEVDDGDTEDERVMSDEERARLQEERTKQIMTDVMNEYVARTKEQEKNEPQKKPAISPWIPVLIAVIVSLAVGLLVLLLK